MKLAYRFLSIPDVCSYLPGELSRLEYVRVEAMEADEYARCLLRGWRRFGHTLFRPRCLGCAACRSLRVDVARFEPDRSQRRALKANEDLSFQVEQPAIGPEELALFARFHEDRSATRGWHDREEDLASFHDSFLDNPFRTEQWRFELDGELVGLGYVDDLPIGLSAIYFVHDPAYRRRSLGTYNILRMIAEARRRELPHVYLGYHVRECLSLAYKSRFRPCEILAADGSWQAYDERESESGGLAGPSILRP